MFGSGLVTERCHYPYNWDALSYPNSVGGRQTPLFSLIPTSPNIETKDIGLLMSLTVEDSVSCPELVQRS